MIGKSFYGYPTLPKEECSFWGSLWMILQPKRHCPPMEMEGRGVVNFSVNQPSYAITTATTEFDDELIRRGIISFEEAMVRKGASYDDAMRLKQIKEQERQRASMSVKDFTLNDEQDSDIDITDDEFLEQYRERRIQEWKQKQALCDNKNNGVHGSEGSSAFYGQVRFISRQDWAREVNEASQTSWVVIMLTSSDLERTGCTERAIATLAEKFPSVQFVAIPYQQAIANWPEEHLPTLFLYRYGVMQHQLVSLPTRLSCDQLEWKLANLQVLETDLDEEPLDGSSCRSVDNGSYRKSSGMYHGTIFGGQVLELKTSKSVKNDATTAYDDVD